MCNEEHSVAASVSQTESTRGGVLEYFGLGHVLAEASEVIRLNGVFRAFWSSGRLLPAAISVLAVRCVHLVALAVFASLALHTVVAAVFPYNS